jgi:ABC-type Fe3+/spermidine/putrescine transport system ATPase subunit
LYGLQDLHQGEIFIGKERVLGPSYNLIPGHKDMKLVSQDYYVLDNHTVEENIKDMLIGFSNDYKDARCKKILKLLDLQAIAKLQAKTLSSGQKQRVAIARALTVIPKVLLLDEPFNNLDRPLKEKLFTFIVKEVRKKKSSLLLITHEADEALKYSDKIGVMDNGKLVQFDKRDKVFYQPKNLKIASLLGDYNVIKKEDLEKSSQLKLKKQLLIRPHQLYILQKTETADVVLTNTSLYFNGKCFELYGETRSGKGVVVYAFTEPKLSERMFVKIKA